MTGTTKGFWQTAPGMITAVAALITAVGGILGVLVQSGLVSGGTDAQGQQSADSQASTGSPADGSSVPTSSGTAQPPSLDGRDLVPWVQATATLVRRDGTSTTVKAPTVGLACDTQRLALKSGQRLDLELVRSIEFHTIYTANSSADGVVTLLDGRQLREPIHTWNCPVTGQNELGSVDVALTDIRRVDFHR